MATETISRIGCELAIPRGREGFDIPAMARKLWRPSLMTVAAGVVAGFVQAAELDSDPTHAAGAAVSPPAPEEGDLPKMKRFVFLSLPLAALVAAVALPRSRGPRAI